MAATRYCGNVKISMRLALDAYTQRDQYVCAISVNGKKKGNIYVGTPASISHAIDSPKAYDDAAHAALSFACDEEERGDKDWGILGRLDFSNDSGFKIRRKK